jgi:hypothetical protein
MAKNNRRFGPADRAVAITCLLDSATVAAAATAAGFAAQTLYDDRKRCALSARAWADAVAERARRAPGAPPVSGRPGRWRRWRPG